MASSLPNLSALRLAEAERRVDTNEWVQYDPSLQRVVDNDDLQECPICAERFEPGEWLWLSRGAGGAFQYYTPRQYWKALKSRNGIDPMMSDRPVPDDEVKELVRGPPGVLHDLIDTRQRTSSSKSCSPGAAPAREERAWDTGGGRGEEEDGESEYEDAEEELEAEEWQQALGTPIAEAELNMDNAADLSGPHDGGADNGPANRWARSGPSGPEPRPILHAPRARCDSDPQ